METDAEMHCDELETSHRKGNITYGQRDQDNEGETHKTNF